MRHLHYGALGYCSSRTPGTEPVETFCAQDWTSHAFQSFLDDLVETLRDADGVGVAAPQVHRPQQVIAIEVNPHIPAIRAIQKFPYTYYSTRTYLREYQQ